jgi:hypothetical protein
MTVNESLAGGLQQTLGMLKMHLADFSDAELFIRPVPGANHANWQVGHLIASEAHMVSACGAAIPELPVGFAQLYAKETAGIDDPSRFKTKAELLAQFETTHAAAVAFAQTATAAQLDAPSPMPEFCPTVAAVLGMLTGHITMHIGQIQVLRRKLGKPLLF